MTVLKYVGFIHEERLIIVRSEGKKIGLIASRLPCRIIPRKMRENTYELGVSIVLKEDSIQTGRRVVRCDLCVFREYELCWGD